MINGLAPLLAESTTRTFWQSARLQQFTQWWHWMALLAALALLVSYVLRVYRRDSLDLSPGLKGILLALRLAAIAGLVLFFLGIEKRSERRVTRTSRAVVLVDVSQSMGLADAGTATTDSRLQQVVREFDQGKLLPELRQKHDIAVYAFGGAEPPLPVAVLPRDSQEQASDAEATSQQRDALGRAARASYAAATGLLLLGLFALVIDRVFVRALRGAEGEAYGSLAGVLLGLAALVLAAVTNLRYPEVSWREAWSGQPASVATAPEAPEADPTDTKPAPPDWNASLVARGTETRVGDALRWILDREREAPISGIVLVTDGRSNAGLAPESMLRAAQSSEIGIYPIGLGSEKQPRSVRLVDLEAPQRVYPGDRFTVTGYLQAFGLSGRTFTVELQAAPREGAAANAETGRQERRITLPEDGQIVPVQFEVVPEAPGRDEWSMRVITGADDDLEPRDNQRAAKVEVVDRKSRVLLIAGGPNRDYHFLRNMLYRDKNTQVDVWLQSALPGAAQESNQVLLEFPTDRESLFEYDCLVAFDPDWNQLSDEQVALLDEWVAEKAGGLVVVAGPVNTSRWTRGDLGGGEEGRLARIRDLYPVTFYSRGAATIQLGRVGSETPWPLQFSDEGRRSQFLWLEDSPGENEQTWGRFAGVFGYQAIKDIKPGAVVYARFSDPQSTFAEEQPVYIAGQFYGAGRVVYLGSGEMWRLNELDPRYFETFYTKLIRHVSQGRLLRDSSHGILLVDNERASLGDTISIRATLTDAQYQPLSIESVAASLVSPDGSRQPLKLSRLAQSERPGTYSGQFTATREGDYEVQLAIPGVEGELLRRTVKIRLPARETEQPQRNDALLSDLARQTRGQYYVGLESARGERSQGPLAQQLPVKDQVTFVPGTPDPDFQRRLMHWLLALIAGTLSLEWLLRRWNRLA
jgi:hypothetical protein